MSGGTRPRHAPSPAGARVRVDLRSDTVTRPTPAMRRAMAEAWVGDDVYGDDPTVNALEALAAERLGKEAALFVASGTMANQIAIGLWTRTGDEVVLHADAHPAHHEAGGPAGNWGVNLVGVAGEGGRMPTEGVRAAIRSDEWYLARTGLLMLENTHNVAGGRILPLDACAELAACAREHGLRVHLDGARLFNASVASGIRAAEYAAHANTVSFCLSKGLGAPVGSLLCGPADAILRARRLRSRLGGAWRQAGVLAAAGIFALEQNVERLAEDHRRAKALAKGATALGRWTVCHPVETNIVYLDTADDVAPGGPALGRALEEAGVLVNHTGPSQIRFVTHLGITDACVETTLGVLAALA